MKETSFAAVEPKVYRFNLVYRLYHFAIGFVALVGAAMLYQLLPLAAVLVFFSVFMIARPLVMAVTVDQSSVTLKGMFSTKSLQRSSITAVETKHWGNGDVLIFWGSIDGKEKLEIPALFSFDEAWDTWLSTFRDLSSDRPTSLF